MTEAEWLICIHPDVMLRFLHDHESSRRKLRLFACACFPAIRHLWPDSWLTKEIEVAELYAEGLAGHGETKAARYRAQTIVQWDDYSNSGIVAGAVAALNHNAETASWCLARAEAGVAAGWHPEDWRASRGSDTFLSMFDPAAVVARDAVRSVQCDRLRCIFGNPFRSFAKFDSRWLTPIVQTLAQAAYDNRMMPAGTLDNDRLAVFADAQKDAGCDRTDILVHCRQAGPHFRGCWVVDLVLGKR
jgi:hypothetical protein